MITEDIFLILFFNNCNLRSGEVSINIEFDPLIIIAEHLVLVFFYQSNLKVPTLIVLSTFS